jgi:ferredoxin--NADP+ reductase
MVGTGTGVAPYRGFVRRLFQEDTQAARAYTGQAWLFLGVANRCVSIHGYENKTV